MVKSKRKKKKNTFTHKKKSKKTTSWQNYLTKIYFNPKHPASYQGLEKLYDQVKKEKKFKIKLKQIKEWLQEQDVYTLNKPIQKTFPRSRVIVSGIDAQFDTDLMSTAQYSKSNDNVNFLLVVIDIFSRFLWVYPLSSKFAKNVIEGFKYIFNQSKRLPRLIRSDRGSEFTSKETAHFFKSKNINQIFTNNEKQANYAERVIKTLKSKIRKFMSQENTDRFIDNLQDFVLSYNNTSHKSIHMTPSEVNEKNEREVWWNIYLPTNAEIERAKLRKEQNILFRFKMGDLVRIAKLKSSFQREYDKRWTEEIFKISERFVRQNIPMYKIQDLQGEKIQGTFYQEELQKVKMKNEQMYSIEQLQTRMRGNKKEILVSYKNWPSKFNEWIPADRVVSLK